MEKKKVIVKLPNGMHLRPASELCNFAKNSGSKITLCHGCDKADSCSILQLLTLGLTENEEIEVIVEGPTEHETIDKVTEFFSEGGGI